MKILLLFLADDDHDDRELFKEAIEEIAVKTKVVTFENGVSLMAHLLDTTTKLPDFIFLDLNMPMMTGEECLDDIRSESNLQQIPITIYSTFYNHKQASLLKEKGADRYIQKPNNFSLLKATIERCLESFKVENDETLDKDTYFVI